MKQLDGNMIKQTMDRLYDIQVEGVVFLGESDNITYQLSTSEQKYLLKIHLGTNTKEMINSELTWLLSLHNDSKNNLQFQTPIFNKNGDLVSEVKEDEHQKCFWTLQRWIEGQNIEEQPTEKDLREIVKLLATLHDHSSKWEVPQGFTRPIYDATNLEKSINQLEILVNADVMNLDHLKVFKDVTKKIKTTISSQEISNKTWGIIHSDLHDGNYIKQEETVHAIDFSCCGFGFYLFDIAEVFLHLDANNRKLLINFYKEKRQLQEDYEEVLESFFLWQIIRNFSFLSQNINEHDYLRRAIPAIVEKFCSKYLTGQRFLLQ